MIISTGKRMEMLLNLPQNSTGNLRPPSTRRKRATLSNDLDKNLLDFALNKSHTKKMAGYGKAKVSSEEILGAFTDFIMNFIP